ncbi:hypothetical protein GZ186_11720 [Dermatophilus congolensis]|nr:hypothetical protein [Dermatophilus congolensis]
MNENFSAEGALYGGNFLLECSLVVGFFMIWVGFKEICKEEHRVVGQGKPSNI